MSLEFNRRSFLKYSAAAAVAVAGSSLLVGCGEDEYQKTGKIGSTLKLMGTFTLYDSPDAPTYKRAIMEWENTFTFVVNKYISSNLFLYPRDIEGLPGRDEAV